MHATEIIDYRQLNDSEFAVLIECCGKHKHWHTMHASVVNDESKHTASVQWARNLAAQNHEAALQAELKIKAMIGSKAEHTPQQ
jgi:hypothetical protein